MAVTRLDWDIIESSSSPRLVTFPWITGKVRGGDHAVVLDYIARRWHAEVEKITKAHSWGYAQRDVRGNAGIPSEHSAGIAVDINAPAHPLNVAISKTFTPKQIATIRQIMIDVQGAARWGGEWSRPDGMHVELKGGNVLIGRVADLIRAGKLPEPGKGGNVKPVATVKPKPAPAKPAAKTVSQMATEVIRGKHGNGHDRRRKSLNIDAATYAKVRAEVNRRA